MLWQSVGLILAAGASSRMGRAKALLPVGRDTFVSRMARTMRQGGVGPLIVVTSDVLAAQVAAAVADMAPPVRVVVNPAPERGQLSSWLVGLDAVPTVADVPGVLGCPVDVPLFSAATVLALLAAARRSAAPVVRPERGGQHGHPVWFSRDVFAELRRAPLTEGARTVVRAHADGVLDVPVEEDGPFADIDTPDDYERLVGPFPS